MKREQLEELRHKTSAQFAAARAKRMQRNHPEAKQQKEVAHEIAVSQKAVVGHFDRMRIEPSEDKQGNITYQVPHRIFHPEINFALNPINRGIKRCDKVACGSIAIGIVGMLIGAFVWPIAGLIGLLAIGAGLYRLHKAGQFDGVYNSARNLFSKSSPEEEQPLIQTAACSQ